MPAIMACAAKRDGVFKFIRTTERKLKNVVAHKVVGRAATLTLMSISLLGS